MFVNKDFKFRDDLASSIDTVPIELLMSPFDGIVYRYERVHIKEEEDHAKMNFEYTLINTKEFDEQKLRDNKTFNHTLGLVLNTIILEFVDNAEPESGNSNSQESTEV